jgi:large subunit ribosomal protein L17
MAMLRNMASGLFEHGSIETTMPKAKAVQPFVEKIITLAKQGSFHARRQLESKLNDRKIHSWVADPNVPDSRKENPYFDLPDADDIKFNRYGEVKKAPRLVQHILVNVAPKFIDRDGGYTRIIKTGRHRLGDGADLVVLQLVGEEEGSEASSDNVTGRRRQSDRRDAFAASLGTVATAEVVEEVVTEDAPADEAPPAVEASDEAPKEDTEETSSE